MFLLGLLELVLFNLEPALPDWLDKTGGAVVGTVVHAHFFDPDSRLLDHDVGAGPELYPLPSQLLLPLLYRPLLIFLLSRQGEESRIEVVCMQPCRMLPGDCLYLLVRQGDRVRSPYQ